MVFEHYKKAAKDYDACHTGGFYSFVNDFEADCITALGLKDARLVELGCGTGIMLDKIRILGHRVVGVDSCFEMAAIAADKRFSIIIEDVCNIPFLPNTFDVAYCFKTFPHIEDGEKALLEFARVASRFVVVEFYNRKSLMFLWRKLFPKPVPTKYYSIKEFRQLLPFDLQIVSVDGAMVFCPSNIFWNRGFAWLERHCPKLIRSWFGSHVVVTCKRVL